MPAKIMKSCPMLHLTIHVELILRQVLRFIANFAVDETSYHLQVLVAYGYVYYHSSQIHFSWRINRLK